VPLDENTLLTPLDPVALLGVLVRIKLLKFIGAKVVLVCARAEMVNARAAAMPGRRRISFMGVTYDGAIIVYQWLGGGAGGPWGQDSIRQISAVWDGR
jgi:hypothetical protein